MFVGRIRKEVKQAAGFAFVDFKEFPESGDVGGFEVIDGVLEFVVKAHVAVFYAGGPFDIVDGIDTLEEGGEAFEAVGDFGGDEVQVNTAALLEVSELGDFHAVEHDLPADAPGTEGGVLPVILFKFEVVLAEVNADGFEAAHVLFDDVCGGGLEDDLQLHVFVEAVGVIAIAAIGGATAGLHVAGAVGVGAEGAQEGFGAGGAGTHFHVIRLLNDAAARAPVLFQTEDIFLEGGDFRRGHGVRGHRHFRRRLRAWER